MTATERLSSVRVLCVGDVMLDHFVYGTVERISPEAPIPVLKVVREAKMLGGAGNVARNIAALGARATLIAATGEDEAAKAIGALAKDEQHLSMRLVTLPGRPTALKMRFVAHSQQVLRADHEDASAIDASAEAQICKLIDGAIADCDIVVLSDYAKGLLTPRVIAHACAAARSRNKPVVVDPKSTDFTRYRGANILTPNAKELAAATGMAVSDNAAVEKAAAAALRQGGFDALLVTRSQDGMTIAAKSGTALHLPAVTREVFDVSGAGDTAIATFALALASGATLEKAAEIANVAAGIAVGKSGTAVVRPDELEHALNSRQLRGAEAKIQSLKAAVETVATWRARGLKIGFTNGCFDLVHPGHISLLAQAKATCDKLIVGLNTDASVSALKGPGRPVNTEIARAIVLAALESVDAVVLFGEPTPIALIEALKPDVLIKGADYTIDQIVGAAFVASYGGRVHLADLTPGQSTTNIVERLQLPKRT